MISVADRQEADFRREFEDVLAERLARFFYPHDPNDDIGLDAAAFH